MDSSKKTSFQSSRRACAINSERCEWAQISRNSILYIWQIDIILFWLQLQLHHTCSVAWLCIRLPMTFPINLLALRCKCQMLHLRGLRLPVHIISKFSFPCISSTDNFRALLQIFPCLQTHPIPNDGSEKCRHIMVCFDSAIYLTLRPFNQVPTFSI